MMVIAMKCINYLFCPFAFGYPVENITMGNVFKKCPEEHTAQKGQYDSHYRIIQLISAEIEHIYNYRQINSPDDQWVCFSEHFKILIPEKPGLPFIINFFKLHAAKITRK
jgi:hypothetical protein